MEKPIIHHTLVQTKKWYHEHWTTEWEGDVVILNPYIITDRQEAHRLFHHTITHPKYVRIVTQKDRMSDERIDDLMFGSVGPAYIIEKPWLVDTLVEFRCFESGQMNLNDIQSHDPMRIVYTQRNDVD